MRPLGWEVSFEEVRSSQLYFEAAESFRKPGPK
jgi:hypothetical protein